MDASLTSVRPVAPPAFTDIAGLHSISALGRSDKQAALEQVARQFESMFVSQMLKGMRAANEIFGRDNPVNSSEMQFRQEMLDQQLSVSLTQGRGLGLASVLARQLGQQFGASEASASAAPSAAGAGAGQSVEAQLDARRIDAAPLASAMRALPPVVSSALRVIEPLVQQARDTFAPQRQFSGKESFVRAVLPEARRAAQALGVDHRVLIAQSALETGWGQSILSDPAGGSTHNLFNIKAGGFWNGRTVGVSTLEFRHGIPRPERANFRAYDSYGDSFADYVRTLQSQPRYAAALANAGSPAGFVRSLQQAGYATDPGYAHKILELLRDDAIAGAD